MIRFERGPEPTDFDEKVRRPGREWRKTHPQEDRPLPYWSRCTTDLAAAFGHLCGYGAMWLPDGTVDHYISCSTDRSRAYEWDNYRYCSHRMNSRKGTVDDRVLDPFEVEEGWFEVDLRSYQLVMTDKIPAKHRDRAAYTLRRLKLTKAENLLDQRQSYHEAYEAGEISLDYLYTVAPLVARAVAKQSGNST